MNGRGKQGKSKGGANLGLLLLIVAAVVAVVLYFGLSRRGAAKSGGQATAAAMSPSALITNLATIDLSKGTPSPEQIAGWKQSLKSLSSQGEAAVAAIGDFLQKNEDVYFDAPGQAEKFGTASLRLALMDVLGEIGGPEAVKAAQNAFAGSADPAELATLAKFLERAEPGKHREDFVKAASETLTMAASGNLGERDVAPLFEILRAFGTTNQLTDLERYANTWFDYAAITFANWPDGAGVPTLIKVAQNANGAVTLGRDVYQRMLAEAAVKFPAAADELVAQVKGNKIDVAAWPNIGNALAGYTLHLKAYLNPPSPLVGRADTRVLHVAFGNQNFLEATPAENMPQEEVGSRIRLVDRLLESTTDPAAVDAFEGARISLSARLPKTK